MLQSLKWDLRWLHQARFVASFSKDPSTQTGAVIVRPDGKSIASFGYNGFPEAMPDLPEYYDNRLEKYSRIVHCEINALIRTHGTAKGCTLYTWPFLTCDRCAVQMIQAGIVRAVAPICPSDQASRWEETLTKARRYYDECGVEHLEMPFRTDPWSERE